MKPRPPCAICGKPTKEPRRTLCSRECQYQWMSIVKDKRVERLCEWCGGSYKVKRSYVALNNARFCSMACKNKSLEKHHNFVCSKCGQQKTPADFFKDNYKHRGHVARCKDCCRETARTVLRFKPYHREESLRSGAKRRNLLWELTREQFMSFWQKPCVYCGDAIPAIGLDRIDSTKGYTMENLVPCCTTCNRMKSQLSLNEFLERCARIAQRMDVNSAITHRGRF